MSAKRTITNIGVSRVLLNASMYHSRASSEPTTGAGATRDLVEVLSGSSIGVALRDEEHAGYARAFDEWSCELPPCHVEWRPQIPPHPSYQFAGTPDLIIHPKDASRPTLVVIERDYENPVSAIRLAAYRSLWQAAHALLPDAVALRLLASGKPRPRDFAPHEMTQAWQIFLSALNVHRWRETHDRLGEGIR